MMRLLIVGLLVCLLVGASGVYVASLLTKPIDDAATVHEEAQPSLDPDSQLIEYLEQYPYEIGYCAIDVNNGTRLSHHADRSVCLASIVKVFCLTELFRQKHEEGLDLEQVVWSMRHRRRSLHELAGLMIGDSDNVATDLLADFLGRDRVNQMPQRIGLQSISDTAWPDEPTLVRTLDRRVHGERLAEPGLPMHGTAAGIANYFELLLQGKIISEAVSEDLVDFFLTHPKPFSDQFADRYEIAGKGGNILWTRPPKHYSVMGWGLFLRDESGHRIVLCVWGEWFPEDMEPDEQLEFLTAVTDDLISILRGRASAQ